MQLEAIIRNNKQALLQEYANRHFANFVELADKSIEFTPFHTSYYNVINEFVHNGINRLIITMPPQHGKSQASSRLLPAYLLGRNPNLKIAIGSYNTTFARKFNRDIQRYIDTPEYNDIYPETILNRSNAVNSSSNFLRNADEFEIVGKKGSLKVVGRGGGLTGNPVDIMIMDDIYKDSAESNSPVIRESTLDWYLNTVRTRLHNNSKQILVFTRWHEEDLIGYIESKEKVVVLTDLLKEYNPDTWYKINFEAIKESPTTEIDPRMEGEVLWKEKHSLKKLTETRKLDIEKFNCLYQGNPESKEGLLYSTFKTYSELPKTITSRKNYTDIADKGNDYLCSVCYVTDEHENCYITDVIYTQEPYEITEKTVPMMLERNNTIEAHIEANSGGRGFIMLIRNRTRCIIRELNQTSNKESRILTNSAQVTERIYMPMDWESRWGKFAKDLKSFKRLFRANNHDDAPDVLTGIIEKNKKEMPLIVW
jgi:predicted phage terminase large subunit-like protein